MERGNTGRLHCDVFLSPGLETAPLLLPKDLWVAGTSSPEPSVAHCWCGLDTNSCQFAALIMCPALDTVCANWVMHAPHTQAVCTLCSQTVLNNAGHFRGCVCIHHLMNKGSSTISCNTEIFILGTLPDLCYITAAPLPVVITS